MEKNTPHPPDLVAQRNRSLKKNAYYYSQLFRQYQYLIPPGKRVLEVGCRTGDLLNAVQPSFGMGVDINPEMIRAAKDKFPHLNFRAGDITAIEPEQKFDYIFLSGLLGELDDIQVFLTELRRHCHRDTRVVIEYYSYLWIFFFRLAEKLKIKISQRILNWITPTDINNFLHLTGYESIRTERKILFPFGIPLVSYLLNKYMANLPLIDGLTMNYFIIARPLLPVSGQRSVSIVIPCRNEKGNIEDAIRRTPTFGTHQEFIFIEGGSRDGTPEEIQRIIQAYPRQDIKFYQQTGKGKGDAVRLGFEKANGEVLMILDADLTVAPEDLPKFYQALIEDKGEFINGCRLVYPLERQAMRFLNLIANKFFSIFFTWLLGQNFKDTLCGTKVLAKHHYVALAQNRAYFGDFDPFGDFDLIFGATKLNLKIIELPIRYHERQYGQTQIRRFYHGFLLLKMCFFALRKIKLR